VFLYHTQQLDVQMLLFRAPFIQGSHCGVKCSMHLLRFVNLFHNFLDVATKRLTIV
jgi:hypothetical protein